jgi:hypothetical protein
VSQRDRELGQQVQTDLSEFDRTKRRLPGIKNVARRNAFIGQIVESIHRVKFVAAIRARKQSDLRTDPASEMFNPLKAAILNHRRGNIEDAFWLIFLFVHFGKNARGGWRYAREVYGKLGETGRWDWQSTSADPAAFRDWLDKHQNDLKRDGVPGGFGNHRKYESLDARSSAGTGSVVEGYIDWVHPPRTHQELVETAFRQSGGNKGKAFDALYRSMAAVPRFGRTARFDYLTMIAKVGLAAIEAPSPYLRGSTGPLKGAHLLFGAAKHTTPETLDSWVIELGAHLQVGMQVLEDALCNWQKSPAAFKPFRG